MQNLEQIRARNVLKFAAQGPIGGDKGGEVIKKIPSLIQNHGLLATAAYSFSEKEGWPKVFDAIAVHLADEHVAIVPAKIKDRRALLEHLTAPDTPSEVLKQATTETMAWLTYARRFVKKDKEGAR
ncbi:type III-B CRISPR module-associated protein Cmr5 [Verrucomicrobium spinosum]|uniref:type III-B CRISPR module-associated protein Cmr5 n=1 Tax=Verrucomicrobium spinosum TaxID=2736 RepID=UPI000174439A|nr:type III-B CRISPR module-associated protein Cmr5 [Verrucomicrobium spinosum]